MSEIVKSEYPASDVTGRVIGAAMEVHSRLGSGFLESVYEEAMAVEFRHKKIAFERQKELPVYYRDSVIKKFVCDYVVAGTVIVELKAIKALSEIERIQLTSYLKASRLSIGLLLNFGAKSLDFKRMIYSHSQCRQHGPF